MIAYFDCFSGISGDMTLGALLDAGLPLETLREQLDCLDFAGYRLDVTPRADESITGTQVNVVLDDREQPERHLSDIAALLEASRLDRDVVARATAVFARLARAEAAVHGTSVDAVHFHEVGAVDAVVDVVGAVAGLKALGVDQVYASALPLGGGSVRSRHGTLPLPAPGTLELLAEVGAPTRPVSTERELVTPTGAALLAELARFEQPPMRLSRIGYGFGRAKLAWPNCLRIWLGDLIEPSVAREEVSLLEANLDDMTPEGLGYAMERLFEAGALDVYFQPLQMKKNRPAVLLGVLARPTQVAQLACLVLTETTTLGVRVSRLERYVAGRHAAVVETELGPVRVKVKELGDRRIVAPEYDDAARIARERALPLAEVYCAVARAGNAQPTEEPQSS